MPLKVFHSPFSFTINFALLGIISIKYFFMNNLNNPIFYPVLKAFLGWGIQKFWKKSSKCSFLKPFLLQDTLASWVWGLCNMNFSLILMTALVAVVPTLVSGRSCPIFYEEKCEEVPREVCEVSGTSSYRGIFFHPNQLPWHNPQASESLNVIMNRNWNVRLSLFMKSIVRRSLVKSVVKPIEVSFFIPINSLDIILRQGRLRDGLWTGMWDCPSWGLRSLEGVWKEQLCRSKLDLGETFFKSFPFVEKTAIH